MTKNTKTFIDFLIRERGYRVIEIKGEGRVPNTWCLSYINSGVEDYFVILNPETYVYASMYENIILANTRNTNNYINIFNILIEEEKNNLQLCQNTMVLNFEENSFKIIGDFKEENINHIKEGFYIVVSSKEKKKEIFKENLCAISLIIANITYFLISIYFNLKLGEGFIDIDSQVLYKLGSNVNISLLNGEVYRFITSMFLHGGMAHLFFNMYALYSMGSLVEGVYGRKNFFKIYFISGVTASIISSFTLQGISIGASGAIFGLLGAVLVFAYKMRSKIGKGLLYNIITVIAINIFIGITLPNIDNFAHIIGLLSGMIVGFILYAEA